MYGTIELTVTVIVTALPSSALRTGYAIETLSSADSIGAFLPAVAIPAALLTASIAFGIFGAIETVFPASTVRTFHPTIAIRGTTFLRTALVIVRAEVACLSTDMI